MANAIVTVKIMPASPEIDMESLKEKALKDITAFNEGKETKTGIEEVAFGLKALNIIFVMDEAKGSPDPVAEKISAYEEVNSAEVTDVRRAVG
ncbi:elongation factor 1-beta [Candidatus Woesearchaeota archaeon]|nr:elongation factor 1-beta [Candidatus Woesearchaeota archaeon]